MINKKFPPVNYIGNKDKISSWVVESFPEKSGIVLDLFSGGGAIAFEAKKRGYNVITNDALYSSWVVSKALIENKSIRLHQTAIGDSLKQNMDIKRRLELNWLDNKLFFEEEVDELTKLISYSEVQLENYEKYLFQALIRRAMIRKLPYSRMNIDWENIKKLRNEEYSYEKYGRKRAYHNASFSSHMEKDLKKYNEAIFDNCQENKSLHSDALQAIKNSGKVDIIYIDPPYPGTMNRYDNFYGAFDTIFNRGIEYTDITKGPDFLCFIKEIISEGKNKTKHLILSLNSKSIPGVENLHDLFLMYGEVKIEERKHNYQVSGQDNKNENKEILMILTYY